MDHYESLRRILNTHISGAPSSPAIIEILRLLFSEDEVAIAVCMSFRAMTAADIARKANLADEETEKHLKTMADKAVIISRQNSKGTMVYSLLPTVPGIFEVPLNRFRGSPMEEQLSALWRRYNSEGMIASLAGKPTPQMRVIPVEAALTHKSHILPYEVVSELIGKSGAIAVFGCACRISGQHCDSPIDVCLLFGAGAQSAIDKSLARSLTAAEAIEILDQTEAAGLVHCGNNCAEKTNIICSCCPCCCHFLRVLTELGNPHGVATSSYQAVVNVEACSGCGICHEQRCPVKAMVAIGEKATVVAEKCIGCGLCVSTCPTGAVELRKRNNPPETPATIQDMTMKILTDKGKLEAFMEIMNVAVQKN